MRLLVDIGHCRVKWGLARAGEPDGPAGFPRPAGDPADAFDAAWSGLRPERVVVCSVVGAEPVEALGQWVRSVWDIPVVELRARERSGALVNAYPEPAGLGSDRWANLLGARALLGPVDAVVVDAGTAVTVDAVRADGCHLGGAIQAGLQAGRAGLRAAAPALPAEIAEGALPARDTSTAIGAGTLVGLAGAVGRVAAAVGAELSAPRRVLTGGDAGRLAPWLDPGWHHDPALTLRGLATEGDDPCAG